MGGDAQTYKHKFLNKYIFLAEFFLNEYKFEIRIVKIRYKRQVLSHLWESTYLRIDLIIIIII
jgi:hypothetical protein